MMDENGIDAIIAIGGEGTLTAARRLTDAGLKIVGVPKTIDNDLAATDYSFGFDTAVEIATEAIDRLRTTAESHQRCMVVEVMGRHVGWIALHSGMAGGAHAILIPEQPKSIEQICEWVESVRDRGRAPVIVVSEGFHLDTMEEAHSHKGLDAFNRPRLGGIGEMLAPMIEERTGHRVARDRARPHAARRRAERLRPGARHPPRHGGGGRGVRGTLGLDGVAARHRCRERLDRGCDRRAQDGAGRALRGSGAALRLSGSLGCGGLPALREPAGLGSSLPEGRSPTVPRFVQFEEFGSRDYLQVVERERPWPGPGQILVRVMAAGLNPMDYKAYRNEQAAARMGVTLPSGIGQDFAGFVEEQGEGATRFELGQAVLGTAPFASIADFVVVPEDGQVIAKPDPLTFEVAGSLGVVGRTAMALGPLPRPRMSATPCSSVRRPAASACWRRSSRCARARPSSGRRGRRTTSSSSRSASSPSRTATAWPTGCATLIDDDRVTAVLDNHGGGHDRGGARPRRADRAGELDRRVRTGGARRARTSAAGRRAMTSSPSWPHLLAENELVLPIDSIYPIERTVEAYARLEAGHVRGKVVVVTD